MFEEYRTKSWDGVPVTPDSFKMLQKAYGVRVVSWESDDSPQGYATTISMIEAAHAIGGRVLRLGGSDTTQLKKADNVSSGFFVYLVF